MKVLVVGSTYRTIDNFAPVLDKVIASGGAVELMLFPNMGDFSAQFAPCFSYPKRLIFPIWGFSEQFLPVSTLTQFVNEAMSEFNPDIILTECMLNYPSRQIKQSLKDAGHPDTPVVVFQHGFAQSWAAFNHYFRKHCDYFFCYGEGVKAYFSPELQEWVIPVGLPKLERLRTITVQDRGYVLYIAQATPPWREIENGFEAASRALDLPFLIKPHPMYPGFYRTANSERMTMVNPHVDVVPLIANASCVITSGSTSALEALWLDKPLVVIPSQASDQFPPGWMVAADYSHDEILRIFHETKANQAKLEDFLEQHTGGRAFNSVEQCYRAMENIITRHRATSAPIS